MDKPIKAIFINNKKGYGIIISLIYNIKGKL